MDVEAPEREPPLPTFFMTWLKSPCVGLYTKNFWATVPCTRFRLAPVYFVPILFCLVRFAGDFWLIKQYETDFGFSISISICATATVVSLVRALQSRQFAEYIYGTNDFQLDTSPEYRLWFGCLPFSFVITWSGLLTLLLTVPLVYSQVIVMLEINEAPLVVIVLYCSWVLLNRFYTGAIVVTLMAWADLLYADVRKYYKTYVEGASNYSTATREEEFDKLYRRVKSSNQVLQYPLCAYTTWMLSAWAFDLVNELVDHDGQTLSSNGGYVISWSVGVACFFAFLIGLPWFAFARVTCMLERCSEISEQTTVSLEDDPQTALLFRFKVCDTDPAFRIFGAKIDLTKTLGLVILSVVSQTGQTVFKHLHDVL